LIGVIEVLSSEKVNATADDGFTNASELAKQKCPQRFSTGSKNIDDMRAIETGTVTQLYGEPGSGKSLLCYTTCVLLPSEGKAIYIDTEGKFRPHTIKLIAQARGLEPSKVLQNIQVASPSNSHQQEKYIDGACSAIKSDSKIKLLIIDSIINLYKADYSERSKLPQRQQQLNKYMHLLSNIARSNDVAVIVTNHIQSSPHRFSTFSSKAQVPSGGDIISYVASYRLRLMCMFSAKLYAELGRPDKYMAILEHGPSVYSKTYFTIDRSGVTNYTDNVDRSNETWTG
jgi:DNA repair protein RadA